MVKKISSHAQKSLPYLSSLFQKIHPGPYLRITHVLNPPPVKNVICPNYITTPPQKTPPTRSFIRFQIPKINTPPQNLTSAASASPSETRQTPVRKKKFRRKNIFCNPNAQHPPPQTQVFPNMLQTPRITPPPNNLPSFSHPRPEKTPPRYAPPPPGTCFSPPGGSLAF